MSSHLPAPTDDDVLRGFLECRIPALLGRATTIASLERERSAFASSYASDVLTVRLHSGEELRIFLKDFGVTGVAKDGAQQRRDRERRVYQDLLAGTELGTARCYGSVWDESRRRFWLLLELVEGSEVRCCELDYWVMAARWLGRCQGHFAPQADRLSKCDFLVHHDANFVRSKAEGAVRDVLQISAPLAGRLARIVEHFEPVVEVMVDQPRTLVHGHYRPCNIIAEVKGEPARICPVDWEQAAFGAAFYDLALLSDGFAPPELDRLFEAYRQEASAHHLDVPENGEMRYIVSCFRLFLGIHLLSRARERGFSEEKAAEIVAQLEQLQRAVAVCTTTV